MEYTMDPKDEFIADLSQALFGKMSQTQINAQVRYYENYIMEEVEKGRTQEEVVAKLGDPYELARTIVGKKEEPKQEEEVPNPEAVVQNRTVKVTRENRFAKAAASHGFQVDNMKEEEEVEIPQRSYTEADQYLEGYKGLKAEFDEEKGWEVKVGNFKLNKWYGTGLIAAIILIIWGIAEKFMQ